MPLADYYERAALAAAQIMGGGFEDTRFRQLLDETPVGIALDREAAASSEGQAMLDLTVRLLARLYPTLSIVSTDGGEDDVQRLRDLAHRVNPRIDLGESADVGISISRGVPPFTETIHVGSDGWDAFVSTSGPQPVGASPVPYGAGAAACFACANLFRRIFLPGWPTSADADLVFSTYDLRRLPTEISPGNVTAGDDPLVLVGAGAIGNAAIWAFSRSTLRGTLHLVDPEVLELSNLQRYVLAERDDDGAVKVDMAGRFFETRAIKLEPHRLSWAEFAAQFGYAWPRILLALDNATDRRAAQASLPRWIANSWTQPGDLGISVHPRFTDGGACVSCLYLQDQQLKNEDELIADALGVPELVPQVRQFLHSGEGLAPQFLDLVAERLAQPPQLLAAFAGRPVRDLYVEGICGGGVLPLGQAGVPDARLHVPLAHQSALAGVLLAAAYERSLTERPFTETCTLKLDLLRPLAAIEPSPAQKRGDGRCICEDDDFRNAYDRKWPTRSRRTTRKSRGTARPAG